MKKDYPHYKWGYYRYRFSLNLSCPFVVWTMKRFRISLAGVQAVCRYETKSRVQTHVDWSELGRIEIDDTGKKLYCFNMILDYSRMRYIEFTLTIDIITLMNSRSNYSHIFERQDRQD